MAYAQVISALADPTRRSVFESLQRGPLTVGELAELHPVSRPAVSQHLQVLLEARLVRVRPEGNRRIYAIDRHGLEELRTYLEGFWSDVLTGYEDRVAQLAEKH